MNKTMILILSLILSFCSIGYELAMANTLSLLNINQILWQSLTIGFFIGGLGLGAAISNSIVNVKSKLIQVEIMITLLGGLSVLFLYLLFGGRNFLDFYLFVKSGHDGYLVSQLSKSFSYFVGGIALAIVTVVGFFTGLELPLLIKYSEKELGASHNETLILAFNYFGTLVGTLFFTFVLKPNFDLIDCVSIIAIINLVVCAYLIKQWGNSVKRFISIVFISCLLTLVFIMNSKVLDLFLKFEYYLPEFTFRSSIEANDLMSKVLEQKNIERTKSMYQYLDVITFPNGEFTFALDQHFQFKSDTEHYYHEGFSHVPIMIHGKVPKKVLILGAGDGLLLRELIKYSDIDSFVNVELDEQVINKAKTDERFLKLNKKSYSDPRVRVVIDDAFYYVRNTTEKFDAVFVDFPYPNSFDLMRLYSREIYTFINRLLNPNGFLVLDAPLERAERQDKAYVSFDIPDSEKDVAPNSILLSTLWYSGFKHQFPYQIEGESFIYVQKNNLNILEDVNSTFNRKMFSDEVFGKIQTIKTQYFPHEIKLKYVNSVFRPKFGSFKSYMLSQPGM